MSDTKKNTAALGFGVPAPRYDLEFPLERVWSSLQPGMGSISSRVRCIEAPLRGRCSTAGAAGNRTRVRDSQRLARNPSAAPFSFPLPLSFRGGGSYPSLDA